MANVEKQALARRDLADIFVYLGENAGLPVAERFLEKAERTFSLLAHNPQIGEAASLKRTKIVGVRKFPIPVRGLKYLIFYLPRQDGISVVRVIHSSQDWQK